MAGKEINLKLLILDSDGMIGHVVKQYFKEHGHNISCFDLKNDFDVLRKKLSEEKYDAVINCVAVINHDAEIDKVSAVKINSLLPHFLEYVTEGTNTIVVHRSTDCIFSGNKGNYTLEDWPDAKSFYARSKALGELDNAKDITIRTSLIGPETSINGSGLFNWFYNQKGEIKGFFNSIWTGITTIEFARDIEILLNKHKHGIFQLVPNYSIRKYDLLLLFQKYYPANRKIVQFENEKVDKSLMPFCDEILVPDYEVQIAEMRHWTDSHKDLYRYQ